MLLILQILSYSFALWLGLYLLSRDFQNDHRRYAAFGLISYAIVLAGDALRLQMADSSEWMRWLRPAVIFPAGFWALALLGLVHENKSRYSWPLVFTMLALYLLGVVSNLADPVIALHAASLGVLLGWLVIRLYRSWQAEREQYSLGLMLLATLFFGLGIGMILIPLELVPAEWMLAAISLDLLVFGYSVAVLDAFEQGETLRRDIVLAFDISFFMTLIFAGQVGLVMGFSTGVTLPMLLLLFGTIAAAISVQMFYRPVARALDQVALADQPEMLAERAQLRTEADILPRLDNAVDVHSMDPDTFQRLTRRALRDFGNLPRLATNPLTRLPVVITRLRDKDQPANTLERAAELKQVLIESIEALKPRDQGDSGTSDEWRHYNVLYYPYVMGLKPYSRHPDLSQLGPEDRAILEWFVTQVPERTMYNWQKSATALIAQNLREMIAVTQRDPI